VCKNETSFDINNLILDCLKNTKQGEFGMDILCFFSLLILFYLSNVRSRKYPYHLIEPEPATLCGPGSDPYFNPIKILKK
jgi:hypothetical protein